MSDARAEHRPSSDPRRHRESWIGPEHLNQGLRIFQLSFFLPLGAFYEVIGERRALILGSGIRLASNTAGSELSTPEDFRASFPGGYVPREWHVHREGYLEVHAFDQSGEIDQVVLCTDPRHETFGGAVALAKQMIGFSTLRSRRGVSGVRSVSAAMNRR